MSEPESGWVGYVADQHGRPSDDGNEHLSEEQRTALRAEADARAERRGRHQATVVVQVYESGEAVPHVQFPKESNLSSQDRTAVNDAVRKAAAALQNWK